MQTEEFIQITRKAVLSILQDRYGYSEDGYVDSRRGKPRWPFPGTVELWIPLPDGEQEYILARALNLSSKGVGVLIDDPLEVGSEVSIAIHEPEATLFGKAMVRHSAAIDHGILAGLEFVY